MIDDKQAPLFPASALPPQETDGQPRLTAEASIQAALGAFEQYMEEEGFAINTRKAFASDVRLLGRYLGIGQPVGEIGTQNLNEFLNWLVYERGVPCSRKSYARRVTTLKVFFGWLHKAGILFADPAAAVIQVSVTSPLPSVPGESELDQALTVTETWRAGDDDHKADARPHLLLTLLLQTGIKKGEAMAIVPNHIDRDNQDEPFLFVRYKNPRLRYKERKIPLEPGWLGVLDEYLAQYQPADTLFTCTARNLEYILTDVAEAAGLDKGLLSFENLRWASALRDFKQRVEQDNIRQRLGLSKITWRETKSKLEKLVAREREERLEIGD
ncbi:MAG: phage integrase N-terminal SAM-like domain-containing protein [Chloroflexi bacterium]|nr:phage integrase N-terminal SAM-like domain-containing protein [Chloroflexota bacterium]MCI0650116.1 phage integrase N-terminal SAM-like domain-containing protein [Chloroflexota bacterium]MCI0731200.1 phage integrase N-terminal SAM-like domain-containing protein [Chloroflexota bacterium]